MSTDRVMFFCGARCEVVIENGDSANEADELTERWAREVEREIKALTGRALLFPCIDRQADYRAEAYEAAERRRTMRTTVISNTQTTLFA